MMVLGSFYSPVLVVEIEDLEGSIVQKYSYEDYSADNSERGSTLAFAVQVES